MLFLPQPAPEELVTLRLSEVQFLRSRHHRNRTQISHPRSRLMAEITRPSRVLHSIFPSAMREYPRNKVHKDVDMYLGLLRTSQARSLTQRTTRAGSNNDMSPTTSTSCEIFRVNFQCSMANLYILACDECHFIFYFCFSFLLFQINLSRIID